MSDIIRLQLYLFVIAVPVNLIWEVAGAYDFPASSSIDDIIGCLIPSLGDGLMMLIIFWVGWVILRDARWFLQPGASGYAIMLFTGMMLAVAVELNAFYVTGAWRYNDRMITIPPLGIGLWPSLQMLLLPPFISVLVQNFRKRCTT